jgi:exopolyphosphatase / guanosine-5'-triphosphate,3'-diphosphate pyrophosphatase
MRIASIDIGTNTLLLLIGEVLSDGSLSIVYDEHTIARLGEGVHASKYINEQAIKRASDILHRYRHLCESFQVEKITIVATSAMRDADNAEYVCSILSTIIQSPISIISGKEEAYLSYIGSKESYENPTIIDIGGGSTEIITMNDDHKIASISLDIGAVRFTEKYFSTYPPSTDSIQEAIAEIKTSLSQFTITVNSPVIVVAGTPTTLACIDQGIDEYDRDKVHGYILTNNAISSITDMLCNTSYDSLFSIKGINPKRADILPAGSLLLKSLLSHFAIDHCIVSTKGLRYGVLYHSIT